ncbi:unnamed protein product [Protopolystoma xenopodis]|uniref:Uncharacterized protein n=1 Tax=Protopolystoma xenopodis TaxID=117903 RepID=A0A3S5AY86_9PLAT|nr:unnamed protein product [Protopolystoma xenopodis]
MSFRCLTPPVGPLSHSCLAKHALPSGSSGICTTNRREQPTHRVYQIFSPKHTQIVRFSVITSSTPHLCKGSKNRAHLLFFKMHSPWPTYMSPKGGGIFNWFTLHSGVCTTGNRQNGLLGFSLQVPGTGWPGERGYATCLRGTRHENLRRRGLNLIPDINNPNSPFSPPGFSYSHPQVDRQPNWFPHAGPPPLNQKHTISSP